MKSIFFCLLISLMFIMGCGNTGPELFKYTQVYPVELQQLHRNVIENLLDEDVDIKGVDRLLGDLDENGTWEDIDYPSQTRGYWSPRFHLSRMLTISKAYQKPGNEFYQKKEVSTKMHTALNHWLNNDFQSPNWWHPVIGTPKLLVQTLILMEPELSQDQIEKAMPILHRCEIGRTGQNKVWQSGNVLLTSLLTKDIEMIEKASMSIHEELVVSTSEGVQPDWSYHQHGPQLQFGNYGLSYVGDMIKWISILRETPYTFEESKIEILRNYMLHGQRWVTWKNEMDISACGRQIGPDRPQSKAESLSADFIKMEKLDPEFAQDYIKANDYRTLAGNKHFWRSDIQIQRTPGYYFSVKMASNRVIGAESCNSENLQGYYLGDGATYLYQSGKEYKNIFPFWDWKKVPGTTVLQDDDPLPVLTARGYRIPSDFVGGVSDGENGIAVLDYSRLGVEAKKSWFMFDDKIVCLGAGIRAHEGIPLTTSINQSYLNGEVRFREGEVEKVAKQNERVLNPSWIMHDDIGYIFPNGGNLKLETKKVEGRWTDVTKLLSDETLSANIFKLWIEHGIDPKNDSYAYILVPNAAKNELVEFEKHAPFDILNTSRRQEVVAKDGAFAAVIFYEAGKSEVFGGIESSQPCLVMVKRTYQGMQISTSDPTQKLEEIVLLLDEKYSGQHATQQDGKTKIRVVLPQNGYAGKSVNIKLNKS